MFVGTKRAGKRGKESIGFAASVVAADQPHRGSVEVFVRGRLARGQVFHGHFVGRQFMASRATQVLGAGAEGVDRERRQGAAADRGVLRSRSGRSSAGLRARQSLLAEVGGQQFKIDAVNEQTEYTMGKHGHHSFASRDGLLPEFPTEEPEYG